MKGKKILIKLLAIVCSAMLLFLSPCARYIDAKSVDKVYAIAPALGGVAAVAGCEFLLAVFASIAVGGIVIEHPESLLSPLAVYAANNYGDSIDDACMNIYNKATGSIESISWSELIDSLSDAHDLTVDNLTGLYVQYCPALLECFDEFISDVIYGDIFVPGLSDVLTDETFQDYDSIKDISGNYVVTGYASGLSSNGRDVITYVYSGNPSSIPFIIKDSYWLSFYRYTGNGISHSSYPMYLGYDMYRNARIDYSGAETANYYSPFSGYGFNIPIFTSKADFYAALESGNYSGALNYTDKTMESVIDLTHVPDLAPDIPPFTKSWQQKEWERIANAPDVIGIGSYGHGVYEDNWGDDIPWIGLESLHEYSHSLLDIYNRIIDDILNGTYDSSENIPGTYSEAWEQTLSDAWDNVEQSTEAVPGESEKDKPTDGDDDDKDDPEGGGGGNGGDSNNEDNNQNIEDIIDKIPDELKAYGKCDGFAQSLVNALEEAGIAYKIIRVSSEDAIYSDKFGEYIGIGYHYGVQVGDTIYDNLTTYGMLLDAWLEDLGLTQGFPDISWDYVIEILAQ